MKKLAININLTLHSGVKLQITEHLLMALKDAARLIIDEMVEVRSDGNDQQMAELADDLARLYEEMLSIRQQVEDAKDA
jgi:hypothetical protein